MTTPAQRPQTPYRPQPTLVKIVTLLACVGTLGAALETSAQTVTPRLDAPQFASGSPTRETAQQLYDTPNRPSPVATTRPV